MATWIQNTWQQGQENTKQLRHEHRTGQRGNRYQNANAGLMQITTLTLAAVK